MPLNSSGEEDARFEDAENKFGRLCPECYGRLARLEDDEETYYCDNCQETYS